VSGVNDKVERLLVQVRHLRAEVAADGPRSDEDRAGGVNRIVAFIWAQAGREGPPPPRLEAGQVAEFLARARAAGLLRHAAGDGEHFASWLMEIIAGLGAAAAAEGVAQ
jgi:hypothetical protein